MSHLGHSSACANLKGAGGGREGSLNPAPADDGNMAQYCQVPGILKEAKNLYYGNFLDFENTVWAK